MHYLLQFICFSSVQFSRSVVSDSLWPHGLLHTRLPCPSPTPGAYSNSCPSSRWCHLTISFSVVPFSSHLQSFLASGSLPMSQFFSSSGQSIGVSASASVLPVNTQNWFPLGWTGLISLQSKGLSIVFSNTTVQKHQFLGTQFFSIVQLSHPYMTTGKTIAFTRQTFVGKVISLLFNMISRGCESDILCINPSSIFPTCVTMCKILSPSLLQFCFLICTMYEIIVPTM